MDKNNLFNIDKDYNGICYLYNNGQPDLQYWFYTNSRFNNSGEENDFLGSIWQIRTISAIIGGIIEKILSIQIGASSTWFNNDIRFGSKKISAYGMVSFDADMNLINQDFAIELMADLELKNLMKSCNFSIVGLKKIGVHMKTTAKSRMSSDDVKEGAGIDDLMQPSISMHVLENIF